MDIFGLLDRLRCITASIEHELKREFDVSPSEYDVLSILEREPVPQRQLSRHTKSSAAAVSRWLTRLVREGWAERTHVADCRRELVCQITRRGRNQLRRIRVHLATQLQPMADELTPEDERVLHQLKENMTRLLRKPSDSNS